MKCPVCETEIRSEWKVCPQCAVPLTTNTPQNQTSQPQANQQPDRIKWSLLLIVIPVFAFFIYLNFSQEPRTVNGSTKPAPSPIVKKQVPSVSFSNVTFRNEHGFIKIIGEATNNSDTNYSGIIATLTFYDDNGSVLNSAPITILNISAGATKTWDSIVPEFSSKPARYKIQVDGGH